MEGDEDEDERDDEDEARTRRQDALLHPQRVSCPTPVE
jgi:hypothetical protein